MCISISSLVSSIFYGIIASLVFFIIVYVIQTLRYCILLKNRFNNTTFTTFHKRYPNIPVQLVTIKVRGNLIKFIGQHIKEDGCFEGQFVMNPLNLKYGDGYYFHDSFEGFSFPRVMIKDKDTLLVEAPYTAVMADEDKNKLRNWREYQAFVWRRGNLLNMPSGAKSTLVDIVSSPTGPAISQYPGHDSHK